MDDKQSKVYEAAAEDFQQYSPSAEGVWFGG